MKNKKSLLSLGLLALVLVLGVGYAVVSSVGLSISGTAKTLTTDSEIAVSFTGEVANNTNGTFVDTTNTTATQNGKTATIAVKDLSRKDDTVTITYTIKNNEKDLDAKLQKPTITVKNADGSVNNYFTVTTEYAGEATDGTKDLVAGASTTIAVTVTLTTTPTTAQSADVTIELVAAPVSQ